MFSNALGMLQGRRPQMQNEDLDEGSAVSAHQAMYNNSGGAPATSQTMGSAAAMQALKMFSGGQGGGSSGGGQNAFIGMAMAQAAQLFDQQSAQGNTHPNATKQDAVSSAAQVSLFHLVLNPRFFSDSLVTDGYEDVYEERDGWWRW